MRTGNPTACVAAACESALDSFSLVVTTALSESIFANISSGWDEVPVFMALKSRLTVCTRSTRSVARRRWAKLRVAGNVREIVSTAAAREAAQEKRQRRAKMRVKKGRRSSADGRLALKRARAICGFASAVEGGASRAASFEATRSAEADSAWKRASQAAHA